MYHKNAAVLMVWFFCVVFMFSVQSDFISRNKAEQEIKRQERITAMKSDPDGLFYARSNLSMDEQQKLARINIEEIQKLTNVEGFDTPDYDRIMALAREILLKAPLTPAAQMAHWNIHTMYMTIDDDASAAKALESYIDKYPDDEWRHFEAFDKLSIFAEDRGDWGAVLFYSEKLLAEDPERYAIVLNKARALLHLGEKAEGKKLLERIIAEDEGSIQYNLAMMEMDDLLAGKYDTPSEQAPGKDTAESEKVKTVSGENPSKKIALEKNLPPEKMTANDPLLIENYRQTMDRMKQLTMGVEVFYLDKMKLPSSLQELLEGGFSREKDMVDAWGREFLFKADADNETCWIASAGSDGRFEGFDQKGSYLLLKGKDIIAYNNDFIFAPELR